MVTATDDASVCSVEPAKTTSVACVNKNPNNENDGVIPSRLQVMSTMSKKKKVVNRSFAIEGYCNVNQFWNVVSQV